MITKNNFFCQFNSYSNVRVAKTTCAITCIGMILSHEGKLEKYGKNGNLDNLFRLVASKHKNNIASVKRKFVFNEFEMYLTLGFDQKLKTETTDIIENDNEFFPTFVVYRGYDHRGSKDIFRDFKMEASLIENYDVKDLAMDILNKKYRYFLASIVSRFKDPDSISKATHVVLVDSVFEKDELVYVSYIDPGETKYENARATVTLSEFSKIYNRFGTAVI